MKTTFRVIQTITNGESRKNHIVEFLTYETATKYLENLTKNFKIEYKINKKDFKKFSEKKINEYYFNNEKGLKCLIIIMD